MPFFEFFEPPSFREPAIPKDILPRDVASMPEVQLREYFRAKGLSNKDIEVIISTRSSYRYNELSVMTNHSEIVASLSSLSPAELKSIVQAEIKLAKATGDYSGLDAQYIEVAAKMSKGEIKYSESKVVEAKPESEIAAQSIQSKESVTPSEVNFRQQQRELKTELEARVEFRSRIGEDISQIDHFRLAEIRNSMNQELTFSKSELTQYDRYIIEKQIELISLELYRDLPLESGMKQTNLSDLSITELRYEKQRIIEYHKGKTIGHHVQFNGSKSIYPDTYRPDTSAHDPLMTAMQMNRNSIQDISMGFHDWTEYSDHLSNIDAIIADKEFIIAEQESKGIFKNDITKLQNEIKEAQLKHQLELKQKAELEAKAQQAKIEAIVLEAKVVTKTQYDKIIAEGGEFVITEEGRYITIGKTCKTMKEANITSTELLGFDVELIDLTGKSSPQYINGYKVEFVQGTSSEAYNPDNSANFKISDSTDRIIGKYSWHPAGHLELINTNYNASQPHFNAKININGKSYDAHINYKN
jgi:hypothetical protein